MLKMPNMAKVIDVREIDGRLYFDLEKTLELMYDALNQTSEIATKNRDVPLGIMITGMSALCKALDDILTAHKVARGMKRLRESVKPSESHTDTVA